MFPASSRIWLMNMALAAVIVLFGVMTFDVWTRSDETITEIRAVGDNGAPSPEKKIIERALSPQAAYGVVADKNLFSASRNEPLTEGSKSGLPRLSEKTIYLYGVVTLGGKTRALIGSPGSGPEAAGGRTKNKWVGVGDAIGNFSVAKIEKDRVVLKEGPDRYEVFLHDTNKPAGQKIAAPSSAAPTVVVNGGTDAAAPDGAPDAGSAASAPSPATSASPAAASVPATGNGEKSGQYNIVNTPFGPIKRKVD